MVVMADAPTLFPDLRAATPPPGKGLHGYYRKPDGWITTAPTTPSNKVGYEMKGFIFLGAYGQFANGVAHGEPKERDARGVPWNPYDEPWRLIFQRDGAKEFCVDQIIAHRWHVRPPYREVVFPQLSGVTVYDLQCPECENRIFSSLNEREVVQQLRVHLTTRVNPRHSYTVTDLKMLGQETGLDFETSRTRVRAVQRVEPKVAEELPNLTPASLEPNLAFTCDVCDWAPRQGLARPEAALRMHKLAMRQKKDAKHVAA